MVTESLRVDFSETNNIGTSERKLPPTMGDTMLDLEAGGPAQSYNPFARREGQSLTWKNISMTLVSLILIPRVVDV
jgi:hypothetical protein